MVAEVVPKTGPLPGRMKRRVGESNENSATKTGRGRAVRPTRRGGNRIVQAMGLAHGPGSAVGQATCDMPRAKRWRPAARHLRDLAPQHTAQRSSDTLRR